MVVFLVFGLVWCGGFWWLVLFCWFVVFSCGCVMFFVFGSCFWGVVLVGIFLVCGVWFGVVFVGLLVCCGLCGV
jgi:hypothetical protein